MPRIEEKPLQDRPAVIFKAFYSSSSMNYNKNYVDTQSAAKAQRAMCNYMCRHKIYDVQISRRENVLRLKKNEAYQKTQDYRSKVMKKFLKTI